MAETLFDSPSLAPGWFVTMRRGQRVAFLLGPYATQEEALALVEDGRRLASQADPWSDFDAFGTALSTRTRPGVLNARLDRSVQPGPDVQSCAARQPTCHQERDPHTDQRPAKCGGPGIPGAKPESQKTESAALCKTVQPRAEESGTPNALVRGMETTHLYSTCTGYCEVPNCPERVKQASTGRWFITMGHAGFNSPANNRAGYESADAATAASARYEAKGRRTER